MEIWDFLRLLHPAIAVIFVFPFIGIVVHFAWQTRQRRGQILAENKSKITPLVGKQHKQFGQWLTGSVVGLTLLGLGYPISKSVVRNQLWLTNSFQLILILLFFALTIVSLILLYRVKPVFWRAVFASLTGLSLVILGFQDGVFRRTSEWYWSHYYIGITAALLMIFSLAIAQDISQDRSNRWRTIHTILNCIALLLFIGQGITGARDLLEIPLSWQEPYIYQCDFVNKTCLTPNTKIPK